MDIWLADPPLFSGAGQGGRQILELLVAFGLTALIGLEREVQGKSAGLRTQAIVGTSAALILLVSKYGFADVLSAGTVVVDPSRIAAQIVSGIGFLGAGLIITRRGAVHGLTTAAAVWESAAIGMAAGAGLLLLAVAVTMLHFVIVLGFTPVASRLNARLRGSVQLRVTYLDGRGVMREILTLCDRHRWQLTELAADAAGDDASGQLGVLMTLSGAGIRSAPTLVARVDGVTGLRQLDIAAE
jgi:putative Mg2+ transporter-C (MgtC) family protein